MNKEELSKKLIRLREEIKTLKNTITYLKRHAESIGSEMSMHKHELIRLKDKGDKNG